MTAQVDGNADNAGKRLRTLPVVAAIFFMRRVKGRGRILSPPPPIFIRQPKIAEGPNSEDGSVVAAVYAARN